MLGGGVLGIGLLEHAEPQAHHRAALDLAFDEHRIDRAPHVVDLHEAGHRDIAGLVVDLHVSDACRIGHRGVRL